MTFAQILDETNELNVPKYDLPCALYTFTKTCDGDDPVIVKFNDNSEDFVMAYHTASGSKFSNGKAQLAFYDHPDYEMKLFIVGGCVTLQATGAAFVSESMTFGEYLDQNMLDRAYANAQLNDAIKYGHRNDSLFSLEFDDYTQRLVLLKYDAQFRSGENTMTVSYNAKSSSNFGYDPAKYTFDYISLPAKEWAGFSDLTVNVITDSYVLDSNLAFVKRDGGYTASCAALPEENISFTLCASENPKYVGKRGGNIFALMIAVVAICFIAAAIDAAQGRETKYRLDADKNLNDLKYLIPDAELRRKAEDEKKKYYKLMFIGLLIGFSIGIVISLVCLSGFVFKDAGLYGYILPVLILCIFGCEFLLIMPSVNKINKIEKKQFKKMRDNFELADNLEIYNFISGIPKREDHPRFMR